MMWIYSPRGTLRLWPLRTAAANNVAAPMLDPATRRLQGDSSRNANAAATQFSPQAKASSTTNSLAVVAGSAFVRAGMGWGESGEGARVHAIAMACRWRGNPVIAILSLAGAVKLSATNRPA